MNNISINKDLLKEDGENLNYSFAQSATQPEIKEKTDFMKDFENGETIEQSQDFVLKHIDKLWKK